MSSSVQDPCDAAVDAKRSPGKHSKKQVTLVSYIAALAVMLTASNLRSGVSAFPPIAQQISQHLGAPAMFIGLVGMAPTAMFALAAILSGPLARALTFRAVVTIAMILAAVGFGARMCAPNAAVFLGGTMVGLVGVGITNTLLPAVIKDYFPYRITVMSIAYMVVGQVAMATASVVSVPLAQAAGWRAAIGAWAIPPALAVLCWVVLVFVVTPGSWWERGTFMMRRAHPRNLAAVVRPSRLALGGDADRPTAQVNIWKHPVSWGIVCMFAMTSSISYCFITWAPKIVVTSGGSDQLGGVIGGIFAAIGIVSSFLAPWAVERFRGGARVVTIMSCTCTFAALGLLLWDPMFQPWLWISLISLGCTTFPLGLILIVTRTREPKAAARLSSGAQGIGYTVACFGPVGFGAMYDITGSWTVGLYGVCVFNALLFAAGMVASRNVFVDDPR